MLQNPKAELFEQKISSVLSSLIQQIMAFTSVETTKKILKTLSKSSLNPGSPKHWEVQTYGQSATTPNSFLLAVSLGEKNTFKALLHNLPREISLLFCLIILLFCQGSHRPSFLMDQILLEGLLVSRTSSGCNNQHLELRLALSVCRCPHVLRVLWGQI